MAKRPVNAIEDSSSSKIIGELPGGSERKSRNRAKSVPLQPEKTLLDCVLAASNSKKRKLSMVGSDVDTPPASSLPSIVVARVPKRAASSNAIPEPNVLSGDAQSNSKPPRKRRKRSSSTPPAPKPSQVATRTRRRAQSRAGSPTPDPSTFEYNPPSRISARLALKVHPFISSRSSDIYTHLADPSGSGHLLSDPPVGSIVLNTPTASPVPPSKPAKKPRGRPRKTVDLNDEKTKNALMEEWARIRQSQGAAFPGTPESRRGIQTSQPIAPSSQPDGGHASLQPILSEAENQRITPDLVVDVSQTQTVDELAHTQKTLVDGSDEVSACLQPDLEKVLDFEMRSPTPFAIPPPLSPVVCQHSVTPHPGEHPEDQPVSESLAVVADDVPPLDNAQFASLEEAQFPAVTPFEPTPIEVSAAGGVVSLPDELQHDEAVHQPDNLTQAPPTVHRNGEPPIQADSIIDPPEGHQADTTDMDHRQPAHPPSPVPTSPAHSTAEDSGIEFEYNEDFHMLDVPDILTLPWEPVTSRIYVPPSLGHLIKGMKRQLDAESHARRRAEKLYQTELRKRMAAEQVIQNLRAELEQTQKETGGSLSQSATASSLPGSQGETSVIGAS